MRSACFVVCLAAIVTVPDPPIARQTMAPAPTTTSCGAGSARSLDFWVGRWDVFNAKGQVTAQSVIETVAEGCGILERYTGRPGPRGNRYIGAGLHVFDTGVGKWRQLYSDTQPAITEMQGRVTDAGVVYEWEVKEGQGKLVPKRYTLSRADEGVRQHGERSDDQGKTWTTEFDLRYRKASQ